MLTMVGSFSFFHAMEFPHEMKPYGFGILWIAAMLRFKKKKLEYD